TPAATASAAATATPTATPATAGAPTSAGAVQEAGVIYLIGSDDFLYRYDGATGALDAVSGRAGFLDETTEGVLTVGRDGLLSFLRWDGTVGPGPCGLGTVLYTSRDGACLYREADDSVTFSVPGDATRQPLAPGWSIGGATWDHSVTRVAFLRSLPGAVAEERAHNGLWVRERDGTLRQLYESDVATAFVTAPLWSPDGRSIAIFETPFMSSSIARDGTKLLLIDVATGAVTDLGTAFGLDWVSWSPAGELTFVRGAGRETWRDKRLVVRRPGGPERELAIPNAEHVQLAPVWSASGDLVFVAGPSDDTTVYDTTGYMDGTGTGDRRGMVLHADGSTTEVRCPEGVVEGIRPSADGRSFLLLCRAPGEGGYPLSLWLLGPGADAAVSLVRGLGLSADDAGGFGYYGKHPTLGTSTAWSLAPR
ncbi:MAG: TolB family protein, partial [Candidatus Limnocylindria bacterium]